MILAFDVVSVPTAFAVAALAACGGLIWYATTLPAKGPGERSLVVRLIARLLPDCQGTTACTCGNGWRRLVGRPFVFPPIVLAALLIGQHWHSTQLTVGIYIPAVLLLIGWTGCVVRYRDNRHRKPNDPQSPPATSWEAFLGRWIPDVGVPLLVLLGLIEVFRIQADGWPLPEGANQWLVDRGGIAAEAFRYAVFLWIIAFALVPIRRLFESDSRILDFAGAVFVGGALALMVAAATTYYAEARTDASAHFRLGHRVTVSLDRYGDDMKLAKLFAPRVALDMDEHWQLTSIVRLKHAHPGIRVRDTSAGSQKLGAPALLSGLVASDLTCAGAVPCYQVDLRRFMHQDCTKGGTETRPSCPNNPTVYARVLRPDRDSAAFPSERIPGRRIGRIIEYWQFYGYDSWQRETPLGVLYQHHDGDWEAVFVAITTTRRPLWVAYTSHCGGVVVRWHSVHVWGRTHPYDFVAIGSHGNYANEAPHTPDWMGCAGRTKHAGTIADAVDSLSDIREKVDPSSAGDQPGRIPMVIMATSEPLLTAPVWWGTLDQTTLTLLTHPFGLLTGTGPESPGCKPLWRQPIGAIYCDKRWDTGGLNLGNTDQFCSRWKTTGLDCGAA